MPWDTVGQIDTFLSFFQEVCFSKAKMIQEPAL